MSEKRALVAAVLIGVGASDIFTQDLEDLPELVVDASPEEPEGQKEPPKTKSQCPSQPVCHHQTGRLPPGPNQEEGDQREAFLPGVGG